MAPFLRTLTALLLLGLPVLRSQAQVNAAFTVDSLVGCDLLEVNFTSLATGPVASHAWVLYNSAGAPVGFSPLTNPSFILDVPDTYDVELTVCDGAGNCDTRYEAVYITLYASPDASYTASTMSGCPPLPVTFTDATAFPSGSFVSRFWIIEGGPLLPTTPSINYTFSAPGWYDVTLVVEDDNGCSAFYEDSVQVFAPPALNPTATDYSACNPPLTTTFSGGVTGTGPFTYLWDFGDGSTSTAPSPTHTYTTTGDFDVTLTVTDANGCTSSLVEPGFIEVEPASVSFVPDPPIGCTGQPVDFDNTSTPSSGTWVWNFGDGSPTSPFFEPTHTYTAAGTYTVNLNGSFGSGCSDLASVTLTVVNPPAGDFTSPDPEDCQAPATINFTALPGPGVTGYLWDFGDGGTSTLANPSHTYTAFGDYTVSLTLFNASGCGTTVVKNGFVRLRPLNVGFTVDPREGCAPLTVNFDDTTTAPTPIVSWSWDFGTGATASSGAPTYTYPGPGCFDVTLSVVSAAGCTGTRTRTDVVCAGAPGSASFSVPDTSCPAVDVGVGTPGLTAVDVLVDGAFLTTIDEPGSVMTVPSVPSGLHTLTLVAIANGCPDTFSANVFILESVDSFVTVLQDCATPYDVTLILNPAVADSSCGWSWDMGDGTVIANVDTLHYTYDTTGFYPINLTVDCYDLGACGSLSAGGLYILDLEVDFTPNRDFSCSVPAPIIFANASTDGYANDLEYDWSFGDGGDSYVRSPTRNYTLTGEMIVVLTVTDLNGCVDSHTDTVFIGDVVPGLDWTAPCTPLDVSFTDISSSVAPIATWTLDYGDGSVDVFTAPGGPGTWIHTYPSEGSFDATLIITDVNGCVDSVNVEVENSFRQADFSVSDNTPCAGDSITFENLSIGTGLTYHWDFGIPGTGDTSNLFEPGFAYPATGTYSPSLLVTDVYGCQDSLRLLDLITVDTIVVEPFTWSTLVESCNFALVEFFPSPLDTAEACDYLWIFGDGGVSTERTPIYPYTLAGVYDVTLIISNCNGCSDSRRIENAINVIGPYGGYEIADDSVCAGTEVVFYVSAARTDSIDFFPGNGDVIRIDVPLLDTLAPFVLTYTYDVPGPYRPQIVLQDSVDCLTVLSGDSVWIGEPPTAALSLPYDEACEGFPFELVDLSSSVDPWTANWVFADSTVTGPGGDTAAYAPPNPGPQPFALVIETVFGCLDTALGTVTVLALPDISVNGDTSVCPGSPVQLSASGGIAYAWSPATGLSDPSAPDPFASPSVTTTYTVVVDNGDCIDSASTTVSTVEGLLEGVGPDTIICAGQGVSLFAAFADGLPGNLSFGWSPASGLDDASSATPLATPSVTTVYTLQASCGDLAESGTATVEVVPLPVVVAEPADTTIFLGETVDIVTAVSGGDGLFTYAWTPSFGLSCADCPDPLAGPTGDTEFRLVVTDGTGCRDSAWVRINLRAACDAEVFEIPNLITPNGDGANDRFRFRFEGVARIDQVRIYDRWGDVVFATGDASEAWDGTRNGRPAEQGVYVYTIEAICDNGQRTVVAGNVTLIR
jgi:gliding motility-associated-like protein